MKNKLVRVTVIGVLGFIITSIPGIWIAGSVISAPVQKNIGELPQDLVGNKVEFPSSSRAIIIY